MHSKDIIGICTTYKMQDFPKIWKKSHEYCRGLFGSIVLLHLQDMRAGRL